MCDYSLKAKRTRLAKVDDKLIVSMFGWSTRGFAAPEDRSVAVCLLPGTELSFAEEVRKVHSWPWSPPTIRHKTAIFRKVGDALVLLRDLPSTFQRARSAFADPVS